MGGQHSATQIFDHGGQIHHYTSLTGRKAEEILDFSANINPLGPPASVMDAIQSSLSLIRHYPDPSHSAVKAVLAQHFKVTESEILCGNGASEVIDLLVQHLRPRRVITLEPAFSEYRHSAQRYGIPVTGVPLLGLAALETGEFGSTQAVPGTMNADEPDLSLELPLEQLDALLQADDLVFLNSPHNPTGACFRLNDWLPQAQSWLQRGVKIVVDESFLDFLPDELSYTAIQHAVGSEGLFVVRSATKFYAIPGLRFGFAIGNSSIMQEVEQRRDRWSVNQLAQIAATAAFKDTAFQKATWQWLAAEQAHVKEMWSACKEVVVHVGKVNYFLLRLKETSQGKQLEHHLRQHSMFIRDCSNFTGISEGVYRVAIRTDGENEALFQAVASYFAAHK